MNGNRNMMAMLARNKVVIEWSRARPSRLNLGKITFVKLTNDIDYMRKWQCHR